MKKLITLSIIFTAVITGSILIGGFLSKQQSKSTNSDTTYQSSHNQQNNETVTQTYAAEEVIEHSTESDCWLIIDNRVYDVTEFISKHPGGAERIITYCGKDATTAFATQAGEGTHSSSAKNIQQEYLIGNLQ